MNLRWYSFDWYAGLGLPNEDTTIYALKYQYGAWTNNRHRRINLKFDITGDSHTFGYYAVLTWGSYLALAPTMVLYDDVFVQRHPQIMGNHQQQHIGKPWNSTLSEEAVSELCQQHQLYRSERSFPSLPILKSHSQSFQVILTRYICITIWQPFLLLYCNRHEYCTYTVPSG